MKKGETREKEWGNVPFSKFGPYFKDAMEKTNFSSIYINPFLVLSDSPSLIIQFETLFNDIARHYSSLFPPRNESEESEFHYRVFPETNFNVRIAEALEALFVLVEQKRCDWKGSDFARYSTFLLDEIFSLNNKGESLFPWITSIKERANLHSGQPYVLFSVTYVDADLEGRSGFSISLQAQHFPR